MRLAVVCLLAGVALARHDVGVLRILGPRGEMHGRGPFAPHIAVYNYGTEIERDFPVWCRIDSAGALKYEDWSSENANLWPGHELWVDGFPPWYPWPGYYSGSVTAWTALPGDENPANDTMRGEFTLILSHYVSELCSERTFPPRLDGLIGPDEFWYDAEMSDTAGRGGVVRRRGSCLVLTNHVHDYAYVAVDAIASLDRADGDRVVIKFDENADGVWAPDSSEGTYTAFISGGIDSILYSWMPGQPCPGCSVVSGTASGNLQFEIQIPIGPERHDLAIDPDADVSAAAISYWRGDSCYGWWPQSLELGNWDDPRFFGQYYWISMAVEDDADRGPEGAHAPGATFAGGVLPLEGGRMKDEGGMELLDITGRKAMLLQPGGNDIRHIVPGIYFLRSADSGGRSAVRKVVIAR